ncbi:MAG: DUF3450 family protein [Oceanipulchritudo sp.]
MKQIGLAGSAVAFLLPLSGSPLEETTNLLEEWVQTERLISEEKADWEADKASMENLLLVYGQEIEALAKIIEEAEADTSAAEVLRAELLEQDEAVKALESKVVEALISVEEQIKQLEGVLPPPLREELTPLFNNLPQDPRASKLAIGQRIQPIAAILTQVQKFNQVVTLVEDFREFETGRTVQTETVYFGLGAAYYVDQANEHAGYGLPGSDGWTWTEDDSLIPTIRSFVDIYRGTQQARYVEVPVSVN